MSPGSTLRLLLPATVVGMLPGLVGPAWVLAQRLGSGKEGVHTTSGTVVSTTPQSVDLKFDSSQMTFAAAKNQPGLIDTIRQLAPGDSVTITWAQKQGNKWIQAIQGRGTVEGVVTAKTAAWIEIKPEAGSPQKLLFPHIADPTTLGAQEAAAVKRMVRAGVGDKVRITWEIAEGKRVADVKFLDKAPGAAKGGSAPAKPATPPKQPPNPSTRSLIHRLKRMAHWP